MTLNCYEKYSHGENLICRVQGGAVKENEQIKLRNVYANRLTTLIFQQTEFSKIPRDLFIDYPNLKIFYVNENKLRILHLDDFEGASNLEEIMIHDTSVKVVPTLLFHFCSSLETIKFYQSPIEVIQDDAFFDLIKLKVLKFLALPLKTYPSNMLADLLSLEQFSMVRCDLEIISSDFFRNNLKLKIISLNDNKITRIPAGVFDGINSLDVLDLFNNKLISVSTSNALTFNGYNNQIQELHITNRSAVINVAENVIRSITCDDMLSVKIAFLYKNKIDSLTCIEKMKLASRIDLSDNNISKLSAQDIEQLQNVATLKIHDNHDLKVTAATFSPMKNLNEFWINSLETYDGISDIIPLLAILRLRTIDWNCTYLQHVASILNKQQIYLRFIHENEDFDSFKCQLQAWEVSRNLKPKSKAFTY